MKEEYKDKTKEQLINDLVESRQRIAELEKAKAERKQAEEKIKQTAEEWKTTFDSITDFVFITDKDFRLIRVNKAFDDTFTVETEELIGKPCYEILHGTNEPIPNCPHKKTIETKKPATTEFFEPHLGVHLEMSTSPIFNEKGVIVGVVHIVKDITERKHAEEEQERLLKELDAKTTEMKRFTYTVSHDLRAPLVTIQGFAEMLRKDLEQNELKKMKSDLKYIESSATKMDRLLTDTLQLSRIGRMVNPPEDVSFGEIVQEALEQTTGQIKSSGVEVSVVEDFPTVHVDRMRIAEVLVNLITNSINYMGEQPSPKIDIGYRVDDTETVFFVRDNGIGIDKSQHEKVFELFYTVDKSGKGTGAGLAIVKRIIEVHNGKVWIESEKGKGCTVCFTLPIKNKEL